MATTSLVPPACCRWRRRRWSRRSTCSAIICRRPACRPRVRRSSKRSATTPRRRASRSPPVATTPTSSRTVNDAIERRRVLELHYYKENEDEFVTREVEPYQLVSGPEGWYLGCYDLGKSDTRHFRLDRMKEARLTRRSFEPREGTDERLAEQEWLVHGEVGSAGVARVWVSPERARWLREERTVVEELADEAVVVELPYGSADWLVREILKGVGDLVVLEPADARKAVLDALRGGK